MNQIKNISISKIIIAVGAIIVLFAILYFGSLYQKNISNKFKGIKISQDVVQNQSSISKTTYSPDGRYSFYEEDTNEVPFSLYVYDSKTNKTTLFKEIGPNAAVYSFSPNNRYAVVDTGTGPGNRGITLIDLESQKIIFSGSGLNILWGSDSRFFVITETTDTFGEYLASDVGPSSVSLYRIFDDKVVEKKLLIGNNKTSFNAIGFDGGEILAYKESIFSKPFSGAENSTYIKPDSYYEYWMDIFSNPVINYKSINLKPFLDGLNQASIINESAGWKTYKSAEFGFEINLPPSMTTKVANEKDARGVFIREDNNDIISISIQDGGSKSLSQHESEFRNQFESMGILITSSKSIINGQNFYVLEANGYCDGDDGCGLPSIHYITKRGSDLYGISFGVDKDMGLNNTKKSILSSFKFLE